MSAAPAVSPVFFALGPHAEHGGAQARSAGALLIGRDPRGAVAARGDGQIVIARGAKDERLV